jgi:glycyl-tRNA synthetase alpha chain
MDTFQQTIFKLKQFWAKHGCVIQEPYDVEVGAGTMCPETFLRVLGPKPYNVAYVQPSRRPADGRYGENPNRLYKHTQLQVILKPAPPNVMDLYLESLAAVGINLDQHDLKFEEDNWESPTLGAWGIGWQVMLDGLEVTQFTYFQQCGGVDLDLVPAELTYGLERLIAFLQDRKSVYDIEWVEGRSYGDVRLLEEQQFSVYNFEKADVKMLWALLDLHEAEAQRLIDEFKGLGEGQEHDKRRFPRGAISVTERVGVIGRVRKLAVGVATAWMQQQELLNAGQEVVAQ